MHQGSDENPFLFAIVSEAISREFSVVLPLELLYTDDLVVIADSEEEVIRKPNVWREGLEKKGLWVNLSIFGGKDVIQRKLQGNSVILGTRCLWMVILMLLWLPEFSVVGLSLGHWALSSVLTAKDFSLLLQRKHFVARINLFFMCTDVGYGHWKEKMNWYCIGQRWEWLDGCVVWK